MKDLLATTLIASSLLFFGCEDPSANKTKAVTSNSNTVVNTNQAPVQPKGETLAITPDNSKVLFTGSKVTGKHEGGFNRFTGWIDLVDNNVEQSAVNVEIETASVFTDTDQLTKHLQTADFFDVEKYPKASFRSTQIIEDKDKGANNFTVTGDFQLHGVTKSITFPSAINVTPGDVDVDAEFSINRKDFGIVYAGKADDLVRDNVVIKLDLKAPRKK